MLIFTVKIGFGLILENGKNMNFGSRKILFTLFLTLLLSFNAFANATSTYVFFLGDNSQSLGNIHLAELTKHEDKTVSMFISQPISNWPAGQSSKALRLSKDRKNLYIIKNSDEFCRVSLSPIIELKECSDTQSISMLQFAFTDDGNQAYAWGLEDFVIIDLETMKNVPKAPLSSGPQKLIYMPPKDGAVSGDQNYLIPESVFGLVSIPKDIVSRSATTAKLKDHHPPWGIATIPNRTKSYIDNSTDGILVLDLNTMKFSSNVIPRVGDRTWVRRTFAMSKDGSYLYYGERDNEVKVIETASDTIIKTISLGGTTRNLTGPISLSDDDKTLFVSSFNKILNVIDVSRIKDGEIIIESYPTNLYLPFDDISHPFSLSIEDTVYFIGDSVTAGFGYCGQESAVLLSCGVNNSMEDVWAFSTGYTLQYCAPPMSEPNNRCSNNNLNGMPWNSPRWRDISESNKPKVAYSYVLAQNQDVANRASVFNWAMTGSTPSHWSPNTSDQDSSSNNGLYSTQLNRIRNSYVVMTLGANPLLSDYIDVAIPNVFNLQKGICADTSHTFEVDSNGISHSIAAPLEYKKDGDVQGVGVCLYEQWQKINQGEHLTSIYKRLIENGNRVIVLGYPSVCPWTFGAWQPMPSVVPGWLGGGPFSGNPCNSLIANTSSKYTDEDGKQLKLSQQDQAFYLGQLVNQWIRDIVMEIDSPDLIFASANPFWEDNQPGLPLEQSNTWVFMNDTWVHPSEAGHQDIAKTVAAAMCQAFSKWCPSDNQSSYMYEWKQD